MSFLLSGGRSFFGVPFRSTFLAFSGALLPFSLITYHNKKKKRRRSAKKRHAHKKLFRTSQRGRAYIIILKNTVIKHKWFDTSSHFRQIYNIKNITSRSNNTEYLFWQYLFWNENYITQTYHLRSTFLKKTERKKKKPAYLYTIIQYKHYSIHLFQHTMYK